MICRSLWCGLSTWSGTSLYERYVSVEPLIAVESLVNNERHAFAECMISVELYLLWTGWSVLSGRMWSRFFSSLAGHVGYCGTVGICLTVSRLVERRTFNNIKCLFNSLGR